MTAKRRKVPEKKAVALALTWDGSRRPIRSLPGKARAFLKAGRLQKIPSPARLPELLHRGGVSELRVCWVPQLRGGDEVLCAPFATSDGLRIRFRAVEWQRFGDVLGVIYRPE
jgi:hypothetical protein